VTSPFDTATLPLRATADVDEVVDLGNVSGELQGIARRILVQHLGAKFFRESFGTVNAVLVETHLDNCQFPLEMLAEGHVVDVDDVDELRELRVELRDSML
jgi:hypothetical protein